MHHDDTESAAYDVSELGKDNLTGFTELAAGEIDEEWMLDILFRLLRTPSPSGRTDAVMQYIGDIVADLGLSSRLTRQGALLVDLPATSGTGTTASGTATTASGTATTASGTATGASGTGTTAEAEASTGAEASAEEDAAERCVVVHADTIGCMVSELKDNGRLGVVPIGTFSSRFAEGARVQIITEFPDVVYTGTILPLKTSGHAYGDEVDTQDVSWEQVEVRVDEDVRDRAGLDELGIEIGNTVALMTNSTMSKSGYINSRHLDGKAGVAIALAAAKSALEGRLRLPHPVTILVTIFEEVGHGASAGVSQNVAELVSIDNAVCAPNQNSLERGITIPLKDMHGPFDYHLTRKLIRLGQRHGLDVARDIFRFYRSDVAAALEAGAGARAALMAFGLDGSHGWERTHVDSLIQCAKLVTLWLQTPLTLEQWDEHQLGELRNFPSQRQPAIAERAGDRQHEGAISNVPRYRGHDEPETES